MSAGILIIAILIAAIFAFIFYLLASKSTSKGTAQKGISYRTLLVSLPKEGKPKEGETPKDYKEVISVFEQLLSNIYAVGPNEQIIFEIIARDNTIYFYVGVPVNLRALVEKQIHSFFPAAHIEEQADFRFFKKE
jgi:hypothetical protein